MGASQTKQLSVTDVVTNMVNETVNNTVNSYKTTAQATQNMKLGCTDEQFALAQKSYEATYKIWSQFGKGPPPEYEMCTYTNIEQSAVVNLKSDSKSKKQMATDISTSLEAKAKQYDSLDKVKDIVGYSDTEKQAIVNITNNIYNRTYNNTLEETINTAVADQNMELTGGKFVNVKQSAVVTMITSQIVDNIMDNKVKQLLTTEADQTTKTTEKSGQVEAVNAVTSMISSIVSSFTSMWIIIIIAVIAGIFMFPSLFCKLPPFGLFLNTIGVCSQNDQQQPQQQMYYQPQMQVYYPQQQMYYQQQMQQQLPTLERPSPLIRQSSESNLLAK